MQIRMILQRLREDEEELRLAYQKEPCEERLQELLSLQARISELEALVHSGQ